MAEVRFYAAVSPDGSFSFNSIEKKKRDVYVAPSDEKYGNMSVRPVRMTPLDGDVPGDVAAAELWRAHKIAWIWRNEDGSFWLDTLSDSQEEATAWSSSPERSRAMGMAVIPVKFEIA